MCNTCGCNVTDGNRHLLATVHAQVLDGGATGGAARAASDRAGAASGHGHDVAQPHGDPHDHQHGHQHGHPRRHPHGDGHAHQQEHGHDHGHVHDHLHDHSQDHSHDHAHADDDVRAILSGLLDHNDALARANRARLDAHGVCCINLMSSPGSGKTALLEATIRALRDAGVRMAVIEGDLETENDAQRIRAQGVPAVQITTGTACHLDAHLVAHALDAVDLDRTDLLFVENVGNLVCPASFDLGQHRNVTLLSVTEGDDKPAKYPVMFRAADLMLMTKADLLPHLDDFVPQRARDGLARLATGAPSMLVSARSGLGMDDWLGWLAAERAAHAMRTRHGGTTLPAPWRGGMAAAMAAPAPSSAAPPAPADCGRGPTSPRP